MATEREPPQGVAPLDRSDRSRTTLATPQPDAAMSAQMQSHGPALGADVAAKADSDRPPTPAPAPETDGRALVWTPTSSRDAAFPDGLAPGDVAATDEAQANVSTTSDGAKRRGVGGIRGFLKGPLARRDPRSFVLSPDTLLTQRAEDFRQVRARIKHRLGGHGMIVVVSARHGEGRTITALNLGIAFAQEYERVVYVEADLRRPALHTFFDFEHGKGLSTLLQPTSSSSIHLDTALFRTDVPGFYLLPAGVRCNPPEVVDSPRMDAVAKQLYAQADWTIFDAPPLLSYAETYALLGLVDGVLVLALEGRTRQDDVQELSMRLTAAGANVVGAVYLRHG